MKFKLGDKVRTPNEFSTKGYIDGEVREIYANISSRMHDDGSITEKIKAKYFVMYDGTGTTGYRCICEQKEEDMTLINES